MFLAERAGFEPAVRVNVHTLSRRAPSAARTPLQEGSKGKLEKRQVQSAKAGKQTLIDSFAAEYK